MTICAKTLLVITAILSFGCVELHQSSAAYSAYDEETVAISVLEQDPSVLLCSVESREANMSLESGHDLEEFKHDTMSKNSFKVKSNGDFNNRDTLMARIINAYIVVTSEEE